MHRDERHMSLSLERENAQLSALWHELHGRHLELTTHMIQDPDRHDVVVVPEEAPVRAQGAELDREAMPFVWPRQRRTSTRSSSERSQSRASSSSLGSVRLDEGCTRAAAADRQATRANNRQSLMQTAHAPLPPTAATGRAAAKRMCAITSAGTASGPRRQRAHPSSTSSARDGARQRTGCCRAASSKASTRASLTAPAVAAGSPAG